MIIKIIKRIAYIIVFLTCLSVYSALVSHVALNKNQQNFGVLGKSISYISKFPGLVKKVLLSDEIRGIPPTSVKIDTAFVEINKLDYDLYGVNSFYNNDNNIWEIKLFNFRNDSVIYNWHIKRDYFFKTYKEFANSEPNGTILLPDKSIIVLFSETNNLYRLDSLSNILWHNTQKYFHHTMNLSVDSNIWVCSSASQAIKNSNQSESRYYTDDYIVKVDINTGEILLEKSVSELLIENNLKYLLFKYTNAGSFAVNVFNNDPIHLNDIEVAYKQTSNYNKGDLFLSFRHRSVVIQYRPKSNKVIRIIDGPFINQHDVDIISEDEISLFNNNVISFGDSEIYTNYINTVNDSSIEFTTSYIVKYNLNTETYSLYAPDIFEEEQITTLTAGLHEFISNGDVFVESQNQGKIYVLNEKEVKLRKYFKTGLKGRAHQPHWIRIYEDINFLN